MPLLIQLSQVDDCRQATIQFKRKNPKQQETHKKTTQEDETREEETDEEDK